MDPTIRFQCVNDSGDPFFLIKINQTTGNVGINTTNLTHTLNINGDINLTGSLLKNGSIYSTSQWITNGNLIYYSGGNVGINEAAAKIDFSIHPNPNTNGRVFIHSNDILVHPNITVMDLQGRVVWQKQMQTAQEHLIETNQLVKGFYLIHIQTEKGTATKKVIFE